MNALQRKPNAVIFMTTYNGANYLPEQLDSILGQSFQNWELIISDDGSTDGTMSILREYEREDERITVCENHGSHGAYANYYGLFRKYKQRPDDGADYLFFCDQDDIWMPEKMQVEINVLSELERVYGNKCPLLCCSDMELIDTSGKSLNMRMSDVCDTDLNHNPLNIFFSHCYVWGTSAAINRALWEFAKLPSRGENALSHDNWFAKHAVIAGHGEQIKQPLLKYRRHASNVTMLPKRYSLLEAAKKVTSFSEVVDAQAHIYRSSLEVLSSVGLHDGEFGELRRAFEKGGFSAVHYMKKNRICPGGKAYNQVARYIDLGLCLHKRTRWFTDEWLTR